MEKIICLRQIFTFSYLTPLLYWIFLFYCFFKYSDTVHDTTNSIMVSKIIEIIRLNILNLSNCSIVRLSPSEFPNILKLFPSSVIHWVILKPTKKL